MQRIKQRAKASAADETNYARVVCSVIVDILLEYAS